jgi:hypothetical protein
VSTTTHTIKQVVELDQDDIEAIEELARKSQGITRSAYLRWLIQHAIQDRITFKIYDTGHDA